MTAGQKGHTWEFKPRFRRRAFGWRSQPPILRIRQAVSEIKRVAKKDPVLGAEGAVLFLERVSPALEQVDSSSGAIGTAVNRAIDTLVSIIAKAPADARTRDAWLERLFEAHAEDTIPYIETLADHWGELCASKETASAWADRLLSITRHALGPDPSLRGHYHGTSACLSALFQAGRLEELLSILESETLWHYRYWGARALAEMGRAEDAIRYAQSSGGHWAGGGDIDSFCEKILLSTGRSDEAYRLYGLGDLRGGTYLSTFRKLCRSYPQKNPHEILADLVSQTPGLEGKWFAAAKDAGLYDEALDLARESPCDPRTLARAARDFAESKPVFAVEAGLLALRRFLEGYGYEVTGLDVSTTVTSTLTAGENLGSAAETRERIRKLAMEHDSEIAKWVLRWTSVVRPGPS